MHAQLARLLQKHGLPAEYHDAADDDQPDYSKWIVTSDGPISSKHQDDGFCEQRNTQHSASILLSVYL